MKRAGGILVVLVGVVACEPALPDVSDGCRSNRDCLLGDVCEPALRQCVAEPDNFLVGYFDCTIKDGEQPVSSPGADWIATIDGVRGAYAFGPNCQRLTFGSIEVVRLSAFDFATGRTAFVHLPATGISSDGDVAIGRPDFFGHPATAELLDGERSVAFSLRGEARLTGTTSIGGRLSGSVSIQLVGARDEATRYGQPCPNGAADCGNAYPRCLFSDDSQNSICSDFCDTDAECPQQGAICFARRCTTPCSAGQNDCVAPARCFVEGNNTSGGCL